MISTTAPPGRGTDAHAMHRWMCLLMFTECCVQTGLGGPGVIMGSAGLVVAKAIACRTGAGTQDRL